MVDLNGLITSNSGVQLTLALYINDSGEIAAHGTLPNGDQHAFLLVPCGTGADDMQCSEEGGDSTRAPRPMTCVSQRRPSALVPSYGSFGLWSGPREGAWIDWRPCPEASAIRHNIPNTSSESTWQLSRLRLVGFD